MKIYVAAPFGLAPEVRIIQAKLKDMGHTISQDWTKYQKPGQAEALPDETESIRRTHADLNGAKGCDLFLLLDAPGGRGCYFEAGFAHSWGVPILVVSTRPHLFWSILTVVPNIHKALEAIGPCRP